MVALFSTLMELSVSVVMVRFYSKTFTLLTYWPISTGNEFLKGLSTQKVLEHMVNLL